MTRVIMGRNVNDVYDSALVHLRISGVTWPSRNGEVIKAPEPVISEYHRPRERVLWCPTRDANPVFHLIESLWMLSGSNDAGLLVPLNPRMAEYAEEDGHIHGAYGHRWRRHFLQDQLWACVRALQTDPHSRRVVLTMWDPTVDLGATKRDMPCNTQIYFNLSTRDALDMTVCCRSNDAIWGAYGANVVHMSILHEWMALATGLEMGVYRQLSNDLHIYKNMPRFEQIWNSVPDVEKDEYMWGSAPVIPLFEAGQAADFLVDCEAMFANPSPKYRTEFMRTVAGPLLNAYTARKLGLPWRRQVEVMTQSCDWKVAFVKWCNRREQP